ncbi:hypothetical protein [Ornithobacterium rhinotracheale]|uniref:Uncharacterized protein n=1 Tax=Ornithobacterium rhinotracheale (strain ATCC 51463 / DSM 15997 / CCUG 23171 / CIP 104009 / LMG 9086) TaxID=867902 RepID=I4A306_ORNRL|nr:hypothetical protein [Ornithobacterium rhinotracheale]AFL98340.1 hypothetical protein Ornrh_2209 [Ornithobacterium rhinotracheale DSM 15997]AIQ00724.1 hypothetical protein Q785_11175 [Ornithobacterium rhinotracheale ORT-UMN 88]KGB65803.1 hypothetical protein Q787_10700 [Ornithobacterium rhinotracheale H06-030791]MCK0193313.1 hypothetical protein [Ornithobacterium rhinotracheale]MCK0201183.1 hypothetical protein [Ornithobacterium rhinotracheale]
MKEILKIGIFIFIIILLFPETFLGITLFGFIIFKDILLILTILCVFLIPILLVKNWSKNETCSTRENIKPTEKKFNSEDFYQKNTFLSKKKNCDATLRKKRLKKYRFYN